MRSGNDRSEAVLGSSRKDPANVTVGGGVVRN